MDYSELNNIWDYYLSLEEDLARTSQYVEPAGQENVHSFEFAKILILACTELESVFKQLCLAISGKLLDKSTIVDYKKIILSTYPQIIDAEVFIPRLHDNISPFKEWNERLSWWQDYNSVKHNRRQSFEKATYLNAVTALSALYISIFYLAKTINEDFRGVGSKYIHSYYSGRLLVTAPDKQLPDFEISPK